MKSIVTAATLSLLAAGSAQALTTTDSVSAPSTATDWNLTVSLDKFDGSLGTLNSVTLTLEGVVSGSVQIERTSSFIAPNRTYSFNLSSDILATVAGFPGLSLYAAPVAASSVSLAVFDGTKDFAGTSGYTNLGVTSSDTVSTSLTSGFAGLIGTGTFDIVLDAYGSSGASGGGNYEFIATNLASAVVTVTYDYTAFPAEVPLPAGMPLLAGALGGLALVRRRKAKKAA